MSFPSIRRDGFSALPPAMKREAVLLMFEADVSAAEIGACTGLRLSTIDDLASHPPARHSLAPLQTEAGR